MARDVHTSPVRGMRDLLPRECELRDWAIAKILDTYRRFGFQRIETPALEHLPLLTGGDGGENEKLIFKVLKRGDELRSAHKERDAAVAASTAANVTVLTPEGAEKHDNILVDAGLRYDLTVPLARFYAEHQAELPVPFKSIQIGPVWRAERPQKGRFRQFTQCDIDILGEASEFAEIDLILATTEALSALDLSGFTVRINDRRILTAMLEWAGVPPDLRAPTLTILDKKDKLDEVTLSNELSQLLKDREAVGHLGDMLGFGDSVQARDDVVGDDVSIEMLWNLIEQDKPSILTVRMSPEAATVGENFDSLRRIAATVRAAATTPVRVIHDPTLVRGMGYYTGPIFEIGVEGLPYSIAGGGRYDRMIGKLLGREVPACGFSIGFERVIALLLERGVTAPREGRLLALLHDASSDPIDAAAGPAAPTLARVFGAAATLRAEGHAVSLQLKRKKLGKQLDDLQKLGFDGAATLPADGGPPQVKWFADRAATERGA